MFGYLVKSGGFIMKLVKTLVTVLLAVVFSVSLFAGYRAATPEQVARASMSACALARNIQELESADIYVMGNPEIAIALKKYEGQKVGSVVVRSIKSGDSLPKFKPNVLICGNNSYVEEVKKYCRRNNILSIGASSNSCKKGLSMSLVQESNQSDQNSLSPVKLLINQEASLYESIQWYKAISAVSFKVNSNDDYAYLSY